MMLTHTCGRLASGPAGLAGLQAEAVAAAVVAVPLAALPAAT